MTNWQIALSIIFIWAGFVSAISFMEAWLKFRAPGVTLPVGLSIGRLIFKALNKVEWVFGIIVLLLLYTGENYELAELTLLFLPVLILLMQTIWLLPAMNKRAEQIISGAEVPRSNLHFYYIGAELIKLMSLVMFGVSLFR